MTDEELQEILDVLQAHQADTAAVEAKRAADGLPKSIRGTLSAFSNSPGGGVIVLGVDEASDFNVVGIGDPGKLQANFTSMCAEMEPPLRPVVGIHEIEGKYLFVAEIPELTPSQKPCYHRGAGLTNGSFIRVGDADQHMTSYEVVVMQANAGRPRDDLEPVTEGSIEDFDPVLMEELLRRVRQREPRAFRGKSDIEALKLLRAAREHEGTPVPTLAGWLALADYPQQQFANLNVTFLHYPTSRAGELGPDAQRFIDDRTFSGPLPEIVPEVLHALKVNMTKGAFAGKTFDHWPYPEDAMRECIVNALAHRDYSPMSQGTAVKVELYPDRLIIRSPGGLFGTVKVEDLGEEGVSSTRNEALVRLLEDLPANDTGIPLCQNRGTGVPTMVEAVRKANMRPPSFKDRVSRFEVKFPAASLFSTETLEWLGRFSAYDLSEEQRTALALAHAEGDVSNATLRRATGSDSRVAGTVLQDLASRSFLVQSGVKRWTTYRLPISGQAGEHVQGTLESTLNTVAPLPPVTPKLQETLNLFGRDSQITRKEVQEEFALTSQGANYRLRCLVDMGYLEMTGPPRSRNTAYRLTSPARERAERS